MQNSVAQPDTQETCHRCRREFTTQRVIFYRYTFPADRYCEVCREAEGAEKDQRRADVLLAQANVPREYMSARFEVFRPGVGTKHAFTIAQTWSKGFRHGQATRRGLLFHGPPGSGKTHLSVAILHEAVYGRFARCLFVNVPEWLNALRDLWYADGDEPPNPHGYELIVIDDLGAENATEWSRERIYSLINHRLQEHMPTIITSNLSPGELRGKLGSATTSRLTKLCANVPLDPPADYRSLEADRDA